MKSDRWEDRDDSKAARQSSRRYESRDYAQKRSDRIVSKSKTSFTVSGSKISDGLRGFSASVSDSRTSSAQTSVCSDDRKPLKRSEREKSKRADGRSDDGKKRVVRSSSEIGRDKRRKNKEKEREAKEHRSGSERSSLSSEQSQTKKRSSSEIGRERAKMAKEKKRLLREAGEKNRDRKRDGVRKHAKTKSDSASRGSSKSSKGGAADITISARKRRRSDLKKKLAVVQKKRAQLEGGVSQESSSLSSMTTERSGELINQIDEAAGNVHNVSDGEVVKVGKEVSGGGAQEKIVGEDSFGSAFSHEVQDDSRVNQEDENVAKVSCQKVVTTEAGEMNMEVEECTPSGKFLLSK